MTLIGRRRGACRQGGGTEFEEVASGLELIHVVRQAVAFGEYLFEVYKWLGQDSVQLGDLAMQVIRGCGQFARLLDGGRQPYDRLGDHIWWDGRLLGERFRHWRPESRVFARARGVANVLREMPS